MFEVSLDIARHLLRPSGGLYYHGRALFNQRRWRPFKKQVQNWLESWPCFFNQKLILIGPSAGYTLPTAWLGKFAGINAFDLDPLAGPLFRSRHQLPLAEFHRVNLFWTDSRLSLSPLREILRQNPSANILFCNVLGQVLLEGRTSEDEWLGFLRRLRQSLHRRCWASYHDVLSYTNEEGVDHLTGGDWTQDLQPLELRWQLSKNRVHQLHAVWESKTKITANLGFDSVYKSTPPP